MASPVEIRLPDIGDVDKVTVIELLVAAGDRVEVDDSLITLESDKASMDVPTTVAGVVEKLLVKIGDEVSEGDPIVSLTAADAGAVELAAEHSEPAAAKTTQASPAPRVAAPTVRATAAADIETEVLVLGSGPGGYTAAFRAADLGRRVVLVERYASLGGVCLNVGCIPSKALLHAARVLDEAAAFKEHGIDFGRPEIDLDKLRGWKDSVVEQLTSGIAGLAKRRNIEVVQGEGRLTGQRTLAVEGETGSRTIAFEQAILAAGSRVSRIPGIPYDDSRVIDSTGALELATVPKRLLIVGGGIIGLEMAMVYGALGSAVTVVELMDGLIPGCDRDLVKPLDKRLRSNYGAEILLSTEVSEVKAQRNGLKVAFDGEQAPKPVLYDRVLVAVGRRPNGDRIGAEAAGLAVDERGFVTVDKEQRSNVRHIFAVGDLIGHPMLAHKAMHEARVAAEVAAGEKSAFDARVIPSVAYTDPEIAWAGLTETEAKAQGILYEKSSFPWSASGRALGIGRRDGSTKLLFDPATKRLLGAGIVGTNAGDLIAELALAIEMDCEAADIALTIHPHPTLSETVGLAAEAFEGTITDLYIPRRRKKP
ncbi:MAG: dihydrolipoyl dehydrogenase [Acidobacteria bacterium]|nr:dihydrolipoyl dehydrogenase [Acidobacteriota bacterium]